MKKILASLLVLALCAPAMAATVGIVDNADGTATITVTAEGTANIVGLGLNIDFTADATGDVTAATVDTATFDIYPDAAFTIIDGGGTYGYGDGTPIANQGGRGQASISNSFCISVGALNGIATAGATGSASVEITVTVDGSGTLCVTENGPRGGIVLTDGTGEDITNGTGGEVCGSVTAGGCVVPTCLGDGNGDGSVSGSDVAALLATFNKADPDPAYNCLYDFNADGSVSGSDVAPFIAVFNQPCP
jgi:hypothetical protein